MANSFVRKILFKLIIYSPSLRLRLIIYRRFFNYQIGKNSRIGRTIISAKKVSIGENVTIGNQSLIYCNNLFIGNSTKINSGNIIMGQSDFIIGNDSRIMNSHHFDVSNQIVLGNNTWIAGKGSQFWTHGSTHTKTCKKELSIFIGDNIYIGSNTLIGPGIKIENLNLIGLGSVVTSSIETSKNLISGNPAKIVKKDIDWRENW